MILITGATGNVGREIVKQLSDQGHPVRALSRNPEKVSRPSNVEVVAGNLSDPESLKPALEGVQKVFLIRVPGSEGFPELAKQAGVEHIVFLSSNAISSGVENAIGQMHYEMEQLLRGSGLSWTFLRPGAFMSNTLQWAGLIRAEGVVRAPFGSVPEAAIDPRDIAAVAVEALTGSGHEGEIYPMTGPDALAPKVQVQVLSEVLNQPIEFQEIPESVARENMARFMPADIMESLFSLKKEAAEHPVKVLPTVEQITGKQARPFKQWAADHAEAFR